MLARLLFNVTAGLPCRRIDRSDGQRYLERYAMPLRLRRLLRRLGLTVYLHRFVAEDGDDEVHDHPWRLSLAFVLAGEYWEERVLFISPEYWYAITRRVRWLNIIRLSTFHKIVRSRPETWTLFICTPRIKRFGFLRIDRHDGHQCLIYHNPYPVENSVGWESRAKLGRHTDRAPFQEAA